jgi:hypothetical protein
MTPSARVERPDDVNWMLTLYPSAAAAMGCQVSLSNEEYSLATHRQLANEPRREHPRQPKPDRDREDQPIACIVATSIRIPNAGDATNHGHRHPRKDAAGDNDQQGLGSYSH